MKRFFKSFIFALAGIRDAVKSELSLKLQLVATAAAVAIGIYIGLSDVEWGIVVLSIGFVLAAELFNTAVERLGDEAAAGQFKLVVKRAKDAAAGAVLVAAASALTIGIIFLIIPLFDKLFG